MRWQICIVGRFRSYLRPYALRFVSMAVFAGLGIAATIVVPLITRAVVDGPIAESDRRGLYALGAAAIALGIVEALLMFFRRWIVSKATGRPLLAQDGRRRHKEVYPECGHWVPEEKAAELAASLRSFIG